MENSIQYITKPCFFLIKKIVTKGKLFVWTKLKKVFNLT